MKRSVLLGFVTLLLMGAAGVGHADTISGKIKEINTADNTIILMSQPGETDSQKEYKLVWDANSSDAGRLYKTHAGEFLSVDADQNEITRNWKVANVRGPMAEIENAISTDQRVIEGSIRSLDFRGNSLILMSAEADASGKLTEYHVVWDDTNADVRNRLMKANVGDHISFTADQNKITRNWKANSIVGPVKDLIRADIKTITGEVKSVDASKNSMVLRVMEATGKVVDKKIVWDKDFADQAKLENARVGDRLSVRANQNMLTRNWKVKALGT